MFVGRAAELRSLVDLIDVGSGSAFIIGPPGIGKTSLCENGVERARRAGTVVVWGRAWEFGGAPPFFPWLRVFATLAEGVAAANQVLAHVATRLREGSEDGDARGRLLLFDAARAALVQAASVSAVVIVLDDLHAADPGTLQLARYLQRELGAARVTLVMTARDAEAEAATPPARTLLADLPRDATRTLRLVGLAEPELDEWLPWFCGRRTPDGFARRLVELTGGNPFFVRELIETQRGDLEAIAVGKVGVPRGVREVVAHQASLLDPATQETLQVAAVFGRSSKPTVIAHILERSPARIRAAQQVAVEARLVTPGGDDELLFSHALVCDAIYSELPVQRRLELHAAIVDALPASQLSERTRHAAEAARLDARHAERALTLSLEAGAQAHRALAFEEAARHFGDALGWARETNAGPRVTAEATLAQGEALVAAGSRDEAAAVLHAGAALAVAQGDGRLIARAAIALASTREYMRRDVEKLDLLELAFERLGTEESDIAARLTARLANDLAMQPRSRARRVTLGAQAVALARRVGTPETIAIALEARLQSIYGPDSISERLVTSEEILDHARSRGDVDREIAGLAWKLSALLERGDVVLASAFAREHARLADERRIAGPRINARSRLAMLAFLAGRFDDGFSLANEAREIGARARDPSADLLYRAQLVVPCELLGRRGMLAEGLDVLVRDGPTMIHARAIKVLVARSLLAMGRRDEASAEVLVLAESAFRDVPDDFARVGTLASLADTVTKLGNVDAARTLAELLLPYRAHNAMIGTALSLGAVARYLGRLAFAEGRDEDAEAFLREACERNGAMQARAWLAWSEHDLAIVLRRRGRDDQARQLFESARLHATAVGLAPLLESISSLELGTPSNTAPSGGRHATFRQDDKGWFLEEGGRTLRFADRRGFAYLARLLATPGSEVHALELASSSSDAPRESSTDVVLDAKAKAELRATLHDLRSAVDEAERDGDTGRAALAKKELEQLEEHLAAALGLGGRSRRHGSAAERGRIAVTVAIKRAIETLARDSPEIAAHLSRSIRTGLFCSYDPDPTSALRVTT